MAELILFTLRRIALLAVAVGGLTGCAGLRPASPPEFSAALPANVRAAQDSVDVGWDVARLVPSALAQVEAKLGYAPRGFKVLVCRSECFTRQVRVSGAAAAAINDFVFVNADLLAVTTNLQGVLAHELTHVLLSELRGRELHKVPEWANEGLAVWASGVGTEGCAGASERLQRHHLCVARRAADWLDGNGEAQRCWLQETLTGERDSACPEPVSPAFLAGTSPIPSR